MVSLGDIEQSVRGAPSGVHDKPHYYARGCSCESEVSRTIPALVQTGSLNSCFAQSQNIEDEILLSFKRFRMYGPVYDMSWM